MKKSIISIIALMLCALFATFCFTACGTDSTEGKYVVKSIDGESVDDALKTIAEEQGATVEEFLKEMGMDSAEEFYTLELKSDGTAVLEAKVFQSTTDGTWKQNGDRIELTMQGTTQIFTKNGNELSNDEGDQKFVFVKK